MERDLFLSKISCEFAVITHDLDCNTVTKELDIKPLRFFNKGEPITSTHSSRVGSRPYGLWAIQSKPFTGEDLNVSRHIEYFRELLSDKVDIIQKLRNKYHFECVFAIAIETEDAGAGFDLNEAELAFINKISTRYSCSFITKESIKE